VIERKLPTLDFSLGMIRLDHTFNVFQGGFCLHVLGHQYTLAYSGFLVGIENS
jgi:hypothetical protein